LILPLEKLKVCKPEKDGGPMVDLSLQVILSTLPYPENTFFLQVFFLYEGGYFGEIAIKLKNHYIFWFCICNLIDLLVEQITKITTYKKIHFKMLP